MNILFYPIVDKTKMIQTHQWCDYMVDCLAHGCTQIDDNVEFATDMPHWYKDFEPKNLLYGRGFTISCLLDKAVQIADDVENKIRTGYYDVIIYAIHNNLHKNAEVYKVLDNRPPSKTLVNIICGNDEDNYEQGYNKYGKYYKRENNNGGLAIGFSIPEGKIVKDSILKTKMISGIIPAFGGFSTYAFDNELDYYKEYQSSWYANTWKKGGWDCMRHYEILANGCIPLFTDIHKAKQIGHLPIETLKQILYDFDVYKDNLQYKIDKICDLVEYTSKELTTKRQVKRLCE